MAEALHTIIDRMEEIGKQIRDSQDAIKADLAAQKLTVDEASARIKACEDTASAVTDIRQRLDNLDKELPRGEKVYHSVGSQDSKSVEARDGFARLLMDCALMRKHGRPQYGSIFQARDEFAAPAMDPAQRTQVIDTGGGTPLADGGYLVPDYQRNEIVRLIQEFGLARQVCRVIPMPGKTLRIPTNADLPDVYWDTQANSWVGGGGAGPELGTFTEGKQTFQRPELVAHTLVGFDTISMELDQDSIPGIREFVADSFAMSIAKAEDYQCFMSPGTGTNPFTGIFVDSNVLTVAPADGNGLDTYDEVLRNTNDYTAGDSGYNLLLRLMDRVDESVFDTAQWYMSNSIVTMLRAMRDQEGRPLWTQMSDPAGTQLFGRPLRRGRVLPKRTDASQASKPFIMYGDMRYHAMGDRMQLSLDVSEHAAFKNLGLVVRVAERVCFKNILSTPMATLVTAAN